MKRRRRATEAYDPLSWSPCRLAWEDRFKHWSACQPKSSRRSMGGALHVRLGTIGAATTANGAMFGKVGCSTMHKIQREDTAACFRPMNTLDPSRGSLRMLSTDNCIGASPAAKGSRTGPMRDEYTCWLILGTKHFVFHCAAGSRGRSGAKV